MTSFVENGLNIGRLPLLETLFSLGNGYMGTRAYLEEFKYPGSVRGNYINGVYERIPMRHAEWAWGFPTQTDRMPNLLDLFNITIFLEDEEVEISGKITNFKRELDFQKGLNRRSYKYQTKDGLFAEISFEQLISFTHIQLKTWSLNIKYEGNIRVVNHIDFNISNMINENDPRTAPEHITLVEVIKSKYDLNEGSILMGTINSKIKIEMGFKDSGDFETESSAGEDFLDITFSGHGKLEINRLVKYLDSIRNIQADFIPKEELYKEQISYLSDFDYKSTMDFLDYEELNGAMDFMEFHMLQSSTRDKYGNISAKGLSGEGYEGHYFWDTEIFLFPVWLLWDKERAKNLLLFRYGLLDIARGRAIEMGHQKGACFSWRTISGIESSGFFPAGSAQFHINFDIAYTFIQWWLSNKDLDFLVKYSLELLIETARTAMQIGSMKPDGFHIHTVTGPDEYTALVSDNYYTNKMAQYNLKWAVKLWGIIKEQRYDDWKILKEKLIVLDYEIDNMNDAAERMFIIYDEENGIVAQDSTFLTKAKWPKENNLRPLLLFYHPLTIYRYQVLKQADTILAQYLLDDVSEDVMRRTFYYYESVNTHDSSLSPSVSGLMATKLKDDKLAYEFFMKSVYMDIKDLNHNTSDGLHMANIGGTLISILGGFGGIRLEDDGLHLNPFLPKELGRLRFRFTWRNTILEMLIQEENVQINKIKGPSITLYLRGEKMIIGEKAVLFDLDGVLTGTSDNHYEAWKRLVKELGYELPENFRDDLRGISRMESLDKILEYFHLDYTLEKKIEFAYIKNEYYKESITHFTSENLYPGVKELLERLKKMGVKIGLVSASKNAPGLIRNMGIEKYFDAIVNPQDVERGKPYPDPFLEAAKMLNISKKDCLGVEDAKAGIESINAAGIASLGIGDEDLSEADYVYQTIKEASNFIISWVEDDYGKREIS